MDSNKKEITQAGKEEQTAADMETCYVFLHHIGIPVQAANLDENCFLPGLSVRNGVILVDSRRLLYPGDILHEAGHIAVVPAAERPRLSAATIEKRKQREAEEMMAIAWSYAACIHLDFEPSFVFHADGYRGGGLYLIESFRENNYIGLSMLQSIGLTADEEKAEQLGIAPFPSMTRWTRE